jgi:exopolysaccharide biosynthesis polyprenyl glycosylphosphotransferase
VADTKTENITKALKTSPIPVIKNKSWAVLLQFLSDNFAFALSYSIFFYLNFYSGAVQQTGFPGWQVFFLGMVFVSAFWSVIYLFSGLYKNWYERSPFDEFFLLFRTSLIGCLFIFILVTGDTEKSMRLFILYYWLIMFGISAVFRTAIRRIQIRLRKKRLIQFKTLVLGKPQKIKDAIEKMNLSSSWGLCPIGGISSDADSNLDDDILGNIDNIENSLDKYKPDVLVLVDNELNHDEIFKIIWTCTDLGIRVKIEPDLYNIFTGQTKTHNIYGIPYMEIHPHLMATWERYGKRLFDIMFSLCVIIIGLPAWIGIALAIKLGSKGPVFYTQPRIGLDGKEFRFWKFRSMRPTAKYEANWTKVGDPRVTKVGKFIRKTHLDEIPQFYNVIIGDMSVVGPRPEQPKFVEKFTAEVPYYMRRHLVRPGITGWWQIKYRPHELNTDEIKNRLKDDFYYIENMSLKFDIEIVIRTVWSVLSGHGQS